MANASSSGSGDRSSGPAYGPEYGPANGSERAPPPGANGAAASGNREAAGVANALVSVTRTTYSPMRNSSPSVSSICDSRAIRSAAPLRNTPLVLRSVSR